MLQRSLPYCRLLLGVMSALVLYASLHAASAGAVLADAAGQKDNKAVLELLDQGVDVNAAQGDGMTALHWAAWHGDAPMAQALIDAGANVHATTRINGYTPLFLASKHGHAAVIEALLRVGASPKAVSTLGSTPLMLASASGNVDGVRLLLDAGADVNAAESANGQTAVMFAAAHNRVGVIDVLAARGADLGMTASVTDFYALSRERGGPVPGVDRPYIYPELIGYHGGLTALLFAARQGHAETSRALLAAGADINQVSAGDQTSPLLLAIVNGHFDLAKLLLDEGADPKLEGENGVMPLYAIVNSEWTQKTFYPQIRARLQQQVGYLDLMKALLEKGADPNARLKKKVWYSEFNKDQSSKDEAGATPFWRAAYACDLDSMRLLAAHGADSNIPTIKPAERRRRFFGAAQEVLKDRSGLPQVPVGGPSVTPLLAAAGVGHGKGGGSTRNHHLAGCMPAVKYLVEELGADVNSRDHGGDTALHYAAARGDDEMIAYLVSKGAVVTVVNRDGQTIADMANGPTERGVRPFPETLALLAKLGVTPNNRCVLCS